jgi:putative phosphoesterase
MPTPQLKFDLDPDRLRLHIIRLLWYVVAEATVVLIWATCSPRLVSAKEPWALLVPGLAMGLLVAMVGSVLGRLESNSGPRAAMLWVVTLGVAVALCLFLGVVVSQLSLGVVGGVVIGVSGTLMGSFRTAYLMPRIRSHMTEVRARYASPLTIGVLSDTHIYPHGSRQLPPSILSLFERATVDLILHLGDINHAGVLDELGEVAPVLAVQGNNDTFELLDLLPLKREIAVGRFTIGMVHGHGGRSARQHAADMLAGKVDLACYGHSHIPVIEEVGGTTMLNPGSATDRRWHPHFGVAVVRVTETGIDPELILYSDPRHLDHLTFDPTGDPAKEFPT